MAADVTEQLDDEEVQGLAFTVWSFKQGKMMAVLIHLGDRLGLYRIVAKLQLCNGKATSDIAPTSILVVLQYAT